MKKLFKMKSLVMLLALFIFSLSVVTIVEAVSDVDKCHKFCAAAYGDSFDEYAACMKGCMHGPK
jgi:hypothetical protein